MNEVYYLSSMESTMFEKSRRCEFVRRVLVGNSKPGVIARLTPPIPGDAGEDDTYSTVLITHRHAGYGLFPISSFPCFVFVGKPRLSGEEIELRDSFEASEVDILAWGELYRSEEDARTHRFDDGR